MVRVSAATCSLLCSAQRFVEMPEVHCEMGGPVNELLNQNHLRSSPVVQVTLGVGINDPPLFSPTRAARSYSFSSKNNSGYKLLPFGGASISCAKVVFEGLRTYIVRV